VQELLPGILNQMGADSLTHLKKIMQQVGAAQGDLRPQGMSSFHGWMVLSLDTRCHQQPLGGAVTRQTLPPAKPGEVKDAFVTCLVETSSLSRARAGAPATCHAKKALWLFPAMPAANRIARSTLRAWGSLEDREAVSPGPLPLPQRPLLLPQTTTVRRTNNGSASCSTSGGCPRPGFARCP
jgi:hypothetical protein